jgi:hypothetical protein
MTIIQKAQFAGRLEIKSSTTDGSASVEVSPMLSISLSAILRNIRRIILPERVFGSPGAHCNTSKEAIVLQIELFE